MASVNNEALKKHHFWILFGAVPLLVLIAVIMITSGVGAAIDEKKSAIDKAKQDLNSKSNPKPNDLLAKLEKQIAELGKKRTSLWQENWERQIGFRGGKQVPSENLFRWPHSPNGILDRFNYGEDYATNPYALKFGAPIPDPDGETSSEFRKKEVYLVEFSNPNNPARPGMADRVAPTQFNGGWQRVLRHVLTPEGWGEGRLGSDRMWLALEDIWVQRALLEAVRAVNDQVGAFRRVPARDEKGNPVPDNPLERTFESRNWRVELKVTERESDRKQVLTGFLTNRTDRLQLMGNGNTMLLRVWLSNDPNALPFDFKVSGEFVRGRERVQILTTEDHVIQAGPASEIARVEQVFDTRTVPVRRIERLVLGYPDSRNAGVALKLPKTFKEVDTTASGAGGSGPAGGPPPGMTMGSAGTGTGKPGMPGAPNEGGGSRPQAGGSEGGADAATALDGNRKRYYDATDQVRRMPVAIVLITDQAYLQDVLVAYANSPLRFQVTQVHWQRFRGTIGGGSSFDGSSGSSGDDVEQGKGNTYQGGGFTGSRDDSGPGGLKPGRPGFGSGLGPPGPGGRLPGGPTSGGSMGPMGPMGPGSPFGGGSGLSVSESQLTSGLIEVTVYGTLSLYEKYQPEGGAAPAAPGAAPAGVPTAAPPK